MRRLLIDVNVVLDVLLDRRPFAESSSAVWAAVEHGEAEGLLAAHAVTNLLLGVYVVVFHQWQLW